MNSAAASWFDWAVTQPWRSHFTDDSRTPVHYISWNADDGQTPGLLFATVFSDTVIGGTLPFQVCKLIPDDETVQPRSVNPGQKNGLRGRATYWEPARIFHQGLAVKSG
ncbi:hypothetical protein LMG27174_06218 [Paraburkholderia rhynchosiae]|uniref:Uncharacterized protein n=1 Tax=Paraburkholderia rhynchosiae TaxID=487049 RepID=A0A6J5CHP7_9BURK|nr:hypothetical protein LMG27174_06218 [Paraburkholderia rhynchosiae]